MLTQTQLSSLWVGPSLDWPVMTRNKIFAVDQVELNKVILDHSGSWKNMLGYEPVAKSQAVKGDALASLSPFIEALLVVAPGGEINTNQLRAAVMAAVCAQPELNHTTQKNDSWCGLRVDRIVTVLNHLRRLLDSIKFQQMVSGTQGSNVIIIHKLLGMLDVPASLPTTATEHPPAVPVGEGAASVCEDAEPGKEMEQTPGAKAKRLRMCQKVTPPKVKETNKPIMTAQTLQGLFGSSTSPPKAHTAKTDKKTNATTITKAPHVTHAVQSAGAIYRKEYYKSNHAFGIKRLVDGKAKQIFSLPGRSWSKEKLAELADKVLHDLGKCKSEEDEHAVELLAKYKLGV